MTATWRRHFTRRHEDFDTSTHRDFTAETDSDAALAAMESAGVDAGRGGNTYTHVERIR